jgi:PAS domain-containing protein
VDTAWLAGGGVMGEQVRNFDWSRTPLGPIDEWPQSLRAVAAMLLHSRQPMLLWWGPQLTQLYNDAFVPSLGAGKHPRALGQSGRACWDEAWPVVGKQLEDVWLRGVACYHADTRVPILRDGKLTDVYWSYGYSPVYDESSSISGVLVVCNETTPRALLNQREQQIQNGEGEFRTLAESIPQLAWSARPDGFVDWYNRRWYDYTGSKPEDVAGWDWQKFHDPSLVDRVRQRWQAALAQGHDFEMEFPLRSAGI